MILKIVVDLGVSVCASLEFTDTENLKLFNTLKSLFPNKSFLFLLLSKLTKKSVIFFCFLHSKNNVRSTTGFGLSSLPHVPFSMYDLPYSITSASRVNCHHYHLCSFQRRHSWVLGSHGCPSPESFFAFWLHQSKTHKHKQLQHKPNWRIQ